MWVGGKASQSQESRADPRGADPSPGSTWQCPAHAPRTTMGEQRLGQAGKVEVLVLRCPGSQISEEWNTSSVCAPLWSLPLWEAGWIHTQLAHKSQIWHTKSALIPHCERGQGKSLCWGQEKLHRGADVIEPQHTVWHKDLQQGSSRATQLLPLTLDRSQSSKQGTLEELSICRAGPGRFRVRGSTRQECSRLCTV